MMPFDIDRVRANVRQAATEDLLDRITVFRAGMEPSAIDLMEAELQDRGVSQDDIQAHAEQRRLETQLLPDGTVARCSFCHRPAIAEGWDWHRVWGRLPIFPRRFRYCEEHKPT